MELNIIDSRDEKHLPFDAQVAILKALTHPARIAILEILRGGEHCVCHISAYLGFWQAYISQQLSVLREAGLIQDRRDGWNVYYSVVDSRVFEILDDVKVLSGTSVNVLPAAHGECNCPHCSTKAGFTE